jgi:hypothetical protein
VVEIQIQKQEKHYLALLLHTVDYFTSQSDINAQYSTRTAIKRQQLTEGPKKMAKQVQAKRNDSTQQQH